MRCGSIKMFAADGTYLGLWGTPGGAEGEFRSPSSVAMDPAGNVYVADTRNGRVQGFTPDRDFAIQRSHAHAAGGVYIADLGLGTVQKLEVTLAAMPGATPVT